MLNMIAHMTQAEKDATLKQIADYELGCKVDEEVTLEAWKKYDLYIGDIIHFNMMKCDLISQTDLPVFPFSAEDYRDILAEKTEEERRHKLCEISKYSNIVHIFVSTCKLREIFFSFESIFKFDSVTA